MRGLSGGPEGGAVGSPRAFGHLRERLELPGGWGNGNGGDFATGYSLGLIGGVRSWVCVSSLGFMG
jgi:choline-phosphate cytidylyltransferase